MQVINYNMCFKCLNIPLNLHIIPSILGNAAYFYSDNVDPPPPSAPAPSPAPATATATAPAPMALRPYAGHGLLIHEVSDHT